MKYEQKNCPFCQSRNIKKHGIQNNIQRYYCKSCFKTFTFQKKLSPTEIWIDYTSGKQTYRQLADKYHCSVRTIQRYIDKHPQNQLKAPKDIHLNIIMDTTFFRREFGILVLIDSISKKVVFYCFVKTEKDVYYKLALNRLREKGYVIQSVTCDGRRGLLKDIFNIPVQMCQFHMIAIVMKKLRKRHQSLAGKELKILVKQLTKSNKIEFYKSLHLWSIKHRDFLNERSEIPNEKGYFSYKHRSVRGAYASLKRYKSNLFVFEEYPHLNIERTTNRAEGLFKDLKQKLNNHNGLTRKRKCMFIKDFLNQKSY